jgi:hypothetical protein
MIDGVDCINIYSKGKTDLGKFLSNFTYCFIRTEDGFFKSVEGYWYWLSCKDEKLRDLYGYAAKKYGREIGAKDWIDSDEFQRKITLAIKTKIMNSNYLDEFIRSDLPFVHFYDFGGKIVEPKEGKWVIEFISKLRTELQE